MLSVLLQGFGQVGSLGSVDPECPGLTVEDVSDQPYRWTSGRMLHTEDCEHFIDGQPPRLATEEELVALPVCNTCGGRLGVRGPSSGATLGAKVAESFVCDSCYVRHPIAMRSADGPCRMCAG